MLKKLGRDLDEKFPAVFDQLDHVLAPIELTLKQPVFGCHMCGQCILHSTGMTCPMECPKNLRNGPCGGVGMDGSCEVDRSKPCVWNKAVNRSARLPWSDEIFQRNPPVDWSLKDTSSWVNVITGRDHPERTGPHWQETPVLDRTERQARTTGRFEQLLRAGHFAVTCEINPPDSADATYFLDRVRPLLGLVDAAHISDNSLASPHMSGLALAALIERIGLETILHMTCRDRNRLMLQADVLGAAAFGVQSILCLGGDHTSIGDHKQARPVFDIDSINFIAMLRRMRDEGVFESGRVLDKPPQVFIGGGAEPTAPPLEFRPHRLGKKVAAGLDFAVTQLVFDMDLLSKFMNRVRDLGLDKKIYILIGVAALTGVNMARAINENTPGVVVPEPHIRRLQGVPQKKRRDEGLKMLVEQIQQLREMPGVNGIDMMEVEPEKYLEIIEAAGLKERPIAAAP